ncbi:MAG: 16S rRNA (adenine(1518)-N(6)/adenine(1519)-N(6))-dimethyltransferase RsmA [Candidatus Magasanikbacteria bacterium]
MNEKLFNIDYLKHLCNKFGLRPSKEYGQNYLINPEVIDTMIAVSGVNKKDTVVEVGPGFGILTLDLAAKVKKLLAFEIEIKLKPYWEEISTRLSQSKENNFEIIWGNVLRTDPAIFPKSYKVVANLPYQITSPVLKFFLEDLENKPKEMTLMVQKEVAQRICAKPGEMSVLGLSVQYFGQAEIVGEVKNNNFWPVPQVDSAIIKIILSKRATIRMEDQAFFKLVKIGFAQKRKLLIKNILPTIGKEHKEKFLSELKKMGFTETVRAQELSVANWQQLVKISTLL